MRLRKFTEVRNLAIFACAVLACLFAPTAVRNSAERAFEEFRAPIDAIPSQLSDLEKFWSLSSRSKRELIEAGRDLARLNSAYELKLLENESLRNRVSRLENILNLPSQEKFKAEVARVCRRDISAWWQHITIRKGKRHGIREGYAVVYGGGVVGRVVKADAYTSVVELVGSRKFRMAAHVAGRGQTHNLSGRGRGLDAECAGRGFRRARGLVGKRVVAAETRDVVACGFVSGGRAHWRDSLA